MYPVTLSTFTLRNCCYRPSPEPFHHPKLNSIKSEISIPSPALENHHSAFCVNECAYSWYLFIGGIVPPLSFCDCLISLKIVSSRCLHFIAYVRISLLFEAEYFLLYAYTTICFSIHLLTDAWVVSISWLLWIIIWQTWEYRCLFCILFPFPSDIYPEVGLLDLVVVLIF